MSSPSKNMKKLSRRSFFPILGSSFFLPLLGFGESSPKKTMDKNNNEEDFQTLLKPDGTTVKVKASALKNSKVIKKNISNTSFLKWLDKKV